MRKIVLLSNRVATITEGKTTAGGLAVAVVDALKNEQCAWIGWSGKVARLDQLANLERGSVGQIDTLTWPLSQRSYDGYYRGFANGVIWPAFHYKLDQMRFSRDDYHAYLQVNKEFARRLFEHSAPDALIWVHDYHFLHVAYYCRQLGMKNKIGFFLHIPFPCPSVFKAIPVHRELFQAMLHFDLLGFQTPDDLEALNNYAANMPDPVHANPLAAMPSRGAYPISIDCAATMQDMEQAQDKRTLTKLKKEFGQAKIIISVDRLDYTKGIGERLNSYDLFFRLYPKWKSKTSFIQISPPSRTDVHGYGQIRRELEQLTSQINGKWAEPGWTPINYMNRSFDRPTLLAFFRRAHIGLVTSLRDGMNLVAKEYVMVQAPEDPGVLILSEFAGAAHELGVGALLVNPYDAQAIAHAIGKALSMELAERQERHAAMIKVLKINDLQVWKQRFLHDLSSSAVCPSLPAEPLH